MKSSISFLCLVFLFCIFLTGNAAACTTCTIGQLGRFGKFYSDDKKWSFEYLFEQNHWEKVDAQAIHVLHHNGHDAHAKTTEDYHHFKLGYQINEKWRLSLDLPYVIRRSLEVDNHSILGSQQRAQGIADAQVVGDYRFWKSGAQSLGVIGGLKLPTGAIKEKNSVGDVFEPELQPGSGSTDYLLGGVYRFEGERIFLASNMMYVFINKGKQEFRAGEVLTMSLNAEFLLNPRMRFLHIWLGIDTVYQHESKDVSNEAEISDSGGDTILAGPNVKWVINDRLSLTSAILFPIYQDLGGVHQELDYQWTMGSRIKW